MDTKGKRKRGKIRESRKSMSDYFDRQRGGEEELEFTKRRSRTGQEITQREKKCKREDFLEENGDNLWTGFYNF